MATTRLYPSIGTPAVSPTQDATWTNSPSSIRTLVTSPPGNLNSEPNLAGGGVANANRLIFQLIYVLPNSGKIRGTVRGQNLAFETAVANDYCAQCVIRLLSADGTLVKAVLLAANNAALSNEFATTDANRGFPRGSASQPIALAQASFTSGDLLVIELGFRNFSGSANVGAVRCTGNAASDLPIDETTTSQFNSWTEFSDISFGGQGIIYRDKPKGKMKIAVPGEVRAPSSIKRDVPEGKPLPQNVQTITTAIPSKPIPNTLPSGHPVPEPARPFAAPKQVVSYLTNPPPVREIAALAKLPVDSILEQLAKADKK